jgi:hypothetical protein
MANSQLKDAYECQVVFDEQMGQFTREVENGVAAKVKAHFKKSDVLDEGLLQGFIIEEMCREAARLSRGL